MDHDGPPEHKMFAKREIYSIARERSFFETCLPLINNYHEQLRFMIYFKPCQQQYYIYIFIIRY